MYSTMAYERVRTSIFKTIQESRTLQIAATTRTLIIEKQALFAKALAQILSLDASIQVVGDADSLTDASVRATRPDLILIDIDGANIELNDAVITSRTVVPDVRICALSMHLQPEVMQRCLMAGANGYIVKDVTPVEFLRAIKSVASGESYADARIAGRLLRRNSNNGRPSDSSDLSLREVEVVRLIVSGMSNKEIGYEMKLSEKTVKNHVSRIFSKFNCTARTQAAVHAMRTGLV
jgi:DNA-binding NarL/FixJ family response regulator